MSSSGADGSAGMSMLVPPVGVIVTVIAPGFTVDDDVLRTPVTLKSAV